jgi:hypothetical protein
MFSPVTSHPELSLLLSSPHVEEPKILREEVRTSYGRINIAHECEDSKGKRTICSYCELTL